MGRAGSQFTPGEFTFRKAGSFPNPLTVNLGGEYALPTVKSAGQLQKQGMSAQDIITYGEERLHAMETWLQDWYIRFPKATKEAIAGLKATGSDKA